jgi:transcriptional regulator with XRE-family HTH domain
MLTQGLLRDLAVGSPSIMSKQKEPQTDFGARLIALRKQRGITQSDLAQAAGTTQRMISHYESTAGFPTAPAIPKLAQALGITTDELLGVEKPKRAKLVIGDKPETRRLWRQFQRLLALPEKDRRAVIRLLNSLGQVRGKESDAGLR